MEICSRAAGCEFGASSNGAANKEGRIPALFLLCSVAFGIGRT